MSKLRSAKKHYLELRGKDTQTSKQSLYDLQHEYRLQIAEGDLKGGKAKYMKDIEVVILPNGSAKVVYKGVQVGVYNENSNLSKVRPMIDDLLKQKWFVNELKEMAQ